MKKTLTIGMFMLLFTVPVSAANGDVIGNIYSTDIAAKINGKYVESYCLDGKTAIILDDLEKYGAEISYNDKLRTLIVNTIYMNRLADENVTRETAGNISGKIYESDINVYLNGLKIKAFALNGKMAVAVEDFGNDNSFSQYNAKYTWDEVSRTISLEILIHNYEQLAFSGGMGFSLHAENDNLHIEIDKFTSTSSNAVVEGAPKALFYNGEKVAECFNGKWAEFENNTITVKDLTNLICYDIQKVTAAINSIDKTPTYDEVMDFLNNIPGGVYERIDTDNYTFIYRWYSSRSGISDGLLRIGKDCSFIEYDEFFESVSYNGSKKFENVVIHKAEETVTFHYDKDYIINLKTGIMEELSI